MLAIRNVKLGADHSDTLKAMSNLAVSFVRLNRHAEALQLFEEVGDSGGALFAEEQLAFIEYLARGFKVGAARAEQVIRRARGSGDVAALARANRALATFQSGMNDPAAEATLRASLSAHRRAATCDAGRASSEHDACSGKIRRFDL